MIGRILEARIRESPKSVLLLGPRQVGKSTLCRSLKPDLAIDLADEAIFAQYVKDPSLLRRQIEAEPVRLVLIDEIQRVPSLLNTLQSVIDRDNTLKFLLTGSSARKLKRGKANLLPGRVFMESLPPLVYWELKGQGWNLERALTVGTLPEVYLQKYGAELLESYAAVYLREEIQAEALTKDLGSYSRFLDLAADLSGQYTNYSKIASDSEIHKETIRRYMDILADTLLIERIPSFTKVPKARRARQREKFIFFDLGVRNALVGRHKAKLSKEEIGHLFEQWLTLQLLYFNRLFRKNWRIMTYRDEGNIEVDLLLQSGKNLLGIEIKTSIKADANAFRNLVRFEQMSKTKLQKVVVYWGASSQKFHEGIAYPYEIFLSKFIPAWGE